MSFREEDEPPPPDDGERSFRSAGELRAIHSNEFGRWACPACKAWRWVSMLTRRAEHAEGRSVTLYLDKRAVDVVLQRECPRCSFIWYVDTGNMSKLV